MEKLIYLVWNASGRADASLRADVLERIAPALLDWGVVELTVNLADGVDDAGRTRLPLPPPDDDPAPAVEVALWLDNLDDREPVEALLVPLGDRLAGYLVTESVPTDYGDNEWAAPRDWPDGERSPGVLQLTLMEKPDRLSYDDWLVQWHGTQTPMSTRIQPRIRYVRNAVVRALTPGAPPYLGIVEEVWPSAEHVNDPHLYYLSGGDDEVLAAHLAEMMDSVTAMLDLDRLRLAAMSEYLLRTRPR